MFTITTFSSDALRKDGKSNEKGPIHECSRFSEFDSNMQFGN